MNATTTSEHDPLAFTQLVAESQLFLQFQASIQQVIGLHVTVQSTAPQAAASLLPCLMRLQYPVFVGGRQMMHLCTEAFRILDAPQSDFESCVHQMLDDGCTAEQIRDAQHLFRRLPGISADKSAGLGTLMGIFCQQLSVHAEQIFLQATESEPPTIRRARRYILSHLHQPLSLEDVASHAGISPFHFCKVFKRTTGCTFTEFVNRARIEEAKRLLLKPQSRITEIAYDVGFQSLSQFNRSFRRIASISPTEYRQKAMETHHRRCLH